MEHPVDDIFKVLHSILYYPSFSKMVSTNLMNFTKRLTVVHHSNSSARYDDVFWLFFYQHAAAAAAVLRSSDVGCMAIVQQVGVHGQEGGGGQV